MKKPEPKVGRRRQRLESTARWASRRGRVGKKNTNSHGSWFTESERRGKGGRRRGQPDGVSEVEWRSAGEVTGAEDGADGGGGGGSRSRAERERASERARMRIRVRDWGGQEGMRDWGYSRAGLLASWLLRCAYIDQGQGRPVGAAFVGCSLLGQMGHRAVTMPACTTVPCLGRATGQGGGPDAAWSFGPCRHGPAGHRAMPCPCRATGRADGPRAAWLSISLAHLYLSLRA